VLLEVALNGSRSREEHPAIPRTPEELAAASLGAVVAGAQVLHLHAYGDEGRETLGATACAAAIRAVRSACPGVPISLTTSATIEPDARRRLEIISGWTELPDLVTANQGEEGITELCHHLLGRGVGIEAGLLTVGDAEAFARAGIADRCVRALIEPLDVDGGTAVAHAAAMEDVIVSAGIALEQIHHGEGVASWAVSARGLERGHGIRTGLEDTISLPDGRRAADNADLVRAAAAMLIEARACE
jgi:uncharacterized protein (DUF849 family)